MKMMNKSQFDPERVEALKDILLRLHNGATPESVQEDFDKHFTNVSAVEISLMEHELMNSDTGISFEDYGASQALCASKSHVGCG